MLRRHDYNAEPLCEERKAIFSQQRQEIKKYTENSKLQIYEHFQSDAVLCYTMFFAHKS
jgi:hypothetical protein